MYLLGYDIGSSSVKTSIVDAQSGGFLALCQAPKTEAPIIPARPLWAEQTPKTGGNTSSRQRRKP